ncbi:MAG: class I SAM-dependent RNA methyltransferase [Clostridia bacterium]|nr:class I SAM-dependent RNA methyltransferase [Clostridia bacterium]
MNINMAAPCLMGLEGIVGGELRRMGAENVSPENGRVFFSGDEHMLVRSNLWTRCAERILIVVGKFEARTFDELFEGTKALPWEQWIGKTDAFPVKGSSVSSKLFSVSDCQSIIKKAVVERLKTVYHVPWFEESGAPRQIQFHIMKDCACLMIDTSGDGLHKRGYRRHGVAAPIKETLAAAMADLAIVKSDSCVYDPLCGSGTILIESALKALNVAPGIKRTFSCEKWAQIGADVWAQERERANDFIRRDAVFTAFGSDIDADAVQTASENAYKAGVGKRIQFHRADVRDFAPEGERGIVICNPPYGERLLSTAQAQEIYKELGRLFVRRPGWSYSVITPDEQFEKVFGRKATKRRKLYNGMIKCQLYMYFG